MPEGPSEETLVEGPPREPSLPGNDPGSGSVVEAAGKALAAGNWSGAYELLLAEDRANRLTDPGAMTMLAQAAYLSGHVEAATQAWERLHTLAAVAGDRDGAAAAAAQIVFILFDAVMYAPARAWLARAERLIADRPDSPVRPFTIAMRAWFALVTGDYDTSIEQARDAVSVAEAMGDRDVAAISRVAEGRALIARGDLEEGLAVLDECSVAALSGELTPPTTGAVYCSANCAFQSVSDYERAEQWTRAMERWSEASGITSFQGRCRVHRAQLKRLHGDWKGAAVEATRAGDELAPIAPAERGWALTELGLIRLRTGDLQGAETLFLEAHELGWEPQPGLSLLRMAQGRIPAATRAIQDALDRAADLESREVPPHGALRRLPLLAAQVEIAIAAQDLETAHAAARELDDVASTYGTVAVRATVSGARASVDLAEGDYASALRGFQAALAIWQSLDAPYEAARARVGIAEASRAAGNDERAALELGAALATFERLEAVLDARRVGTVAPRVIARPARGTRLRQTFMFTDIVKSTDLLSAIGDEAWQDLLRWHNETLERLITDHGGSVAQRTGDGFFATFDRDIGAVEAAVAIQRVLAQQRRTAGFAPRVRIGLHAAEADRDGRNWTGIGVHIAARIGALAGAGEIIASRETASEAGLRYGLSTPRLESLKGVADPVEVVTIDWR